MSVTQTSALDALVAGTWTVDTSHSRVGFVVRHLMVAKVRGHFSEFAATITVGEDRLLSGVEATVQAASIDTNDTGRDEHLRSADFFDVEQFPTWTFTSTKVEPAGGDFALSGELTIHGVTRPVVFELTFEGVATDPWGNTKAGFTAETEISRKEFGLDWNAALEAGGVLVGDKVKLQLEIEALKS